MNRLKQAHQQLVAELADKVALASSVNGSLSPVHNRSIIFRVLRLRVALNLKEPKTPPFGFRSQAWRMIRLPMKARCRRPLP